MAPVEHVVVDTTGFIQIDRLQNVAQNIYTVREVVREIKHRSTQQRLQFLPYWVKIRSPSEEAVNAVERFADKTGDLDDLSITDIQVLALTYMLERQYNGTRCIRKEPFSKFEVGAVDTHQLTDVTQVAGFVVDNQGRQRGPTRNSYDNAELLHSRSNNYGSMKNERTVRWKNSDVEAHTGKVEDKFAIPYVEQQNKEEEAPRSERVEEAPRSERVEESSLLDEQANDVVEDNKTVETEVDNKTVETEVDNEIESVTTEMAQASLEHDPDLSLDEETDEDDEDLEAIPEESHSRYDEHEFECSREQRNQQKCRQNEEEGWITPDNIQSANSLMKRTKTGTSVWGKRNVGCITSDFAMQNVLLQMGLNVITTSGRIMTQTRSYVMSCYSCEAKTKNLHRVFCYECGNKTLVKAKVTVGSDGSYNYFVPQKAYRREKITGKIRDKHGLRYMFTADQKKPARKAPKKKETHYGVFEADFIANRSPFELRDTQSKAAHHGWRDFDKRHSGTSMRRRPF